MDKLVECFWSIASLMHQYSFPFQMGAQLLVKTNKEWKEPWQQVQTMNPKVVPGALWVMTASEQGLKEFSSPWVNTLKNLYRLFNIKVAHISISLIFAELYLVPVIKTSALVAYSVWLFAFEARDQTFIIRPTVLCEKDKGILLLYLLRFKTEQHWLTCWIYSSP